MNLVNREEFKLQCYNSEQIRHIWPVAKPLIEKALARGSIYTIQEVFYGLMSKTMQLWMWSDDAALVTTIQTKGGKKFCLLLALAGKGMSDWFQYLYIVEDWASQQGAEEMRIYGRPGWSKQTGYQIEYCKMVKSL